MLPLYRRIVSSTRCGIRTALYSGQCTYAAAGRTNQTIQMSLCMVAQASRAYTCTRWFASDSTQPHMNATSGTAAASLSAAVADTSTTNASRRTKGKPQRKAKHQRQKEKIKTTGATLTSTPTPNKNQPPPPPLTTNADVNSVDPVIALRKIMTRLHYVRNPPGSKTTKKQRDTHNSSAAVVAGTQTTTNSRPGSTKKAFIYHSEAKKASLALYQLSKWFKTNRKLGVFPLEDFRPAFGRMVQTEHFTHTKEFYTRWKEEFLHAAQMLTPPTTAAATTDPTSASSLPSTPTSSIRFLPLVNSHSLSLIMTCLARVAAAGEASAVPKQGEFKHHDDDVPVNPQEQLQWLSEWQKNHPHLVDAELIDASCVNPVLQYLLREGASARQFPAPLAAASRPSASADSSTTSSPATPATSIDHPILPAATGDGGDGGEKEKDDSLTEIPLAAARSFFFDSPFTPVFRSSELSWSILLDGFLRHRLVQEADEAWEVWHTEMNLGKYTPLTLQIRLGIIRTRLAPWIPSTQDGEDENEEQQRHSRGVMVRAEDSSASAIEAARLQGEQLWRLCLEDPSLFLAEGGTTGHFLVFFTNILPPTHPATAVNTVPSVAATTTSDITSSAAAADPAAQAASSNPRLALLLRICEDALEAEKRVQTEHPTAASDDGPSLYFLSSRCISTVFKALHHESDVSIAEQFPMIQSLWSQVNSRVKEAVQGFKETTAKLSRKKNLTQPSSKTRANPTNDPSLEMDESPSYSQPQPQLLTLHRRKVEALAVSVILAYEYLLLLQRSLAASSLNTPPNDSQWNAVWKCWHHDLSPQLKAEGSTKLFKTMFNICSARIRAIRRVEDHAPIYERVDALVREYERTLKLRWKDPQLLCVWMACYQYTGDIERAKIIFTKAGPRPHIDVLIKFISVYLNAYAKVDEDQWRVELKDSFNALMESLMATKQLPGRHLTPTHILNLLRSSHSAGQSFVKANCILPHDPLAMRFWRMTLRISELAGKDKSLLLPPSQRMISYALTQLRRKSAIEHARKNEVAI